MNETQVCKNVNGFILGVLEDRVTYALKNNIKNGILFPDERGKKEPINKIPVKTIEHVCFFLDDFSKFKSHYSNGIKLISPELSTKPTL